MCPGSKPAIIPMLVGRNLRFTRPSGILYRVVRASVAVMRGWHGGCSFPASHETVNPSRLVLDRGDLSRPRLRSRLALLAPGARQQPTRRPSLRGQRAHWGHLPLASRPELGLAPAIPPARGQRRAYLGGPPLLESPGRRPGGGVPRSRRES